MFDDAPRGTQHCSFQPSCALAEHNCKTAIKVETTIDQTIGCQNSLHRVLLSYQPVNPEDFGAGRRMRSAAGEYALATSGDFTLLHCWVSKKFIILPPWYGVEGSRDGAFPLFWWKQRGGTGRGSQVGLWVPGMRADRGCAAEISEAGPCPGSWTDPLKLGPTKPQNPGTLLGTLKVPQNMQTWEKLPKLSGLLSNLHCCWKSLSTRKRSRKIY